MLSTCQSADPEPAKLLTEEEKLEIEMLDLINQHRKEKGLSQLAQDPFIQTQARLHCENMALQRVPFGHSGFDQRVALIKSEIGGNGSSENVANGSSRAKTILDMWLESDGHRKNIEGNYNLTGLGVAKNNQGQYFYTQIFHQK